MILLERICQSIAKSVWSTVSASFPMACFVMAVAFLTYVVIGAICKIYRGHHRRAIEFSHLFRQGIWFGFLAFYTYMVLFRTWIGRPRWEEPLGKIFEGWGLYTKRGIFTTEAIENGMLLLPFTWLLGMLLQERWRKRPAVFVMGRITFCGFLMSLTIETVQVLWNRGTFQFSDLFYNTLGGLLGGLLFVVLHRIGQWRKRKEQL